jgi:hypothetical protein
MACYRVTFTFYLTVQCIDMDHLKLTAVKFVSKASICSFVIAQNANSAAIRHADLICVYN